MSKKFIMAMDQGTTSGRCIIYDKQGRQIAVSQKEFPQIFPKPGWVEHDPMDIWQTQIDVSRQAMEMAGLKAKDIEAIGITNQRETTIVWDKETGKPVYNAIVWQCRRTAEFCDELTSKGVLESVKKKTGLIIDPYFSGTKLRWILENVEGARKKAEEGRLLFGTVETWLIWNLTGGRVHVTDYSNASRTMMFNIHDLCWDKEILEMLDIPESMLPKPVPSSMVYGQTDPEWIGGPVKIAGAAGDQQAALFGQTCFRKGDAKNTYGTGGFMLVNTGAQPVRSSRGLVTTIAWGIGDDVTYALEGSVFVSGAVIQWLRDELDILDDAAESEQMARMTEDNGGVYIVPAFTGLGAPWWDPYARGVLVGITRGVNKNHIARAALESMAYQTADLLGAMEEDMGHPVEKFRVDGGASANDFLLEFQADILGRDIYRPASVETTSLGAAYLAGLATGYWTGLADIADNWQIDKIFTPDMEETKRKQLLSGWHRAVERSLKWEI